MITLKICATALICFLIFCGANEGHPKNSALTALSFIAGLTAFVFLIAYVWQS